MLLTAVREDKGKVVGYINKLQNYDTAEIPKIATQHRLYEEAFMIYKKYEEHGQAINVLVEHMVSLDRGVEYANKVNKPDVWSRFAKAQLDGLRIKDSIGVYRARLHVLQQVLIVHCRFLYQGQRSFKLQRSHRNCNSGRQAQRPGSARKTLCEPAINTTLAYAYAKTDRLHDMDDFLSVTNVADILVVGEKVFRG